MSKCCQKYTRLNTVESILKVEQLHLHTCLGHSNVVFILQVLYWYTCMTFYLIIASSVHVIVHG